MIRRKFCPVCITYTSMLTMETHIDDQDKSSLQLGKWCTTVSTELPKFMNQLWTTYLLTKNP